MGYRWQNECHAELVDVAQLMCASMNGVSGAGVVRCVSISGAAGGQVMNMETTSPAGVVTATQLQVPQIPCDENERVSDLAQMWGMGLVAVLGVFLLREFVVRHVMPQ